jgi:hypothetical protein
MRLFAPQALAEDLPVYGQVFGFGQGVFIEHK